MANKQLNFARLAFVAAIVLLSGAAEAVAQRSSLYKRDEHGAIPLATSSYTYREVIPPREIRLHDLVTVVVVESSQFISEGEFAGKKNSTIDAQLKSWVELDGLNLKPAEQPDGDPRANGTYASLYRAEGELETRDALKFNINARVVDIRPNGNLILEARKRIQVDDEIVEMALIGEARREDIMPNNQITSDKLADSQVFRTTKGHVRDSYKRGWVHKLYDRIAPF